MAQVRTAVQFEKCSTPCLAGSIALLDIISCCSVVIWLRAAEPVINFRFEKRHQATLTLLAAGDRSRLFRAVA
jgi:hypothetical protein